MAPKQERRLVLDSCVWIAYLYEEDSQHEKACTLLRGSTQSLCVPEYVLVEVVNVLANRGVARQATLFLNRVLGDPDVFIPAGELVYDAATRFQNTHGRTLSFVDTALLVLDERYDVVTFDKRLARALKH